MQNTFLPGIIVALAFFSCKAQQTTVSRLPVNPVTNSVSLDSNKWYLTKIHQPAGVIDIITRKAFIRFNEAKGSAGGNGSCNSFGSTMKLEGDRVIFSNIFSTKMYCDEVQSIEDSFLSLLQTITRYEVNGKTLLLFKDNKTVLEFKTE